jgi:O-antigen ligase
VTDSLTHAVRTSGRFNAPGRLVLTRLGIVGTACLATAILGVVAGASPKDAIGIVAVVVFIPVVVTRFTYGVGIFIISTFLGISGTAQKGIGLLVIAVAVAFLAGQDGRSANFFAGHKRITAVILAYLAWCVLGLTWAGNTHDVTYSLTRYVPNFLVFFVVFAAAKDRLDLKVLVAFFLLGSAVAAGDAIISPPGASVYSGVTRSGGTFGDPNYLAAVLVTGFALSVALSRARSVRQSGQAAAVLVAGLCIAGVLFSVSRGGLIALTVTIVAAICLAGRWRAKIAFGSAVLIFCGLLYFVAIAPSADRTRITSSSDGGSGRTTIWKVGWREVQHNVFKGVGAGNFSDAGAKYVLQPGVINHTANGYQSYFLDTPTVAHNTYLEILAEEGVVGFCIFAAIILGSLECMRRAARIYKEAGDEEMELISYGALCGILGFLAASFFLSEEYSKQLYLLLAMGPALLKVATALPSRTGVATARRSRRSLSRAVDRRRLAQAGPWVGR